MLGSFPRGNYVGDKSSERQFFLGAFSRGMLSGSNYLWGNCLGAIIQGQSSKGQLSAGGNFPRGQLSGGQFSFGAIVLGGNCPGGNCLKGNYPGGNFPRGLLSGHHLTSRLYASFYVYLKIDK